MSSGILIDAHILPDIRNDLLNESGPLYDLVNWILSNCGIAMTQLIENHWRTKISSNDRFFWEWYFTEYHVNRRIREIKLKKLDSSKMSKITKECKLPNDIFVKGYIRCAYSTIVPRYILAEDMDFHDPRYKEAETKTKSRIITSRHGKLCRFLEKVLNIRVGSRIDCITRFSIYNGQCSAIVSNACLTCPHT